MKQVYIYATLAAALVLGYFYISSLKNEVKYLEQVARQAQEANAALSRDLNASLKRHEVELEHIQQASEEKEALRSEVEQVRERVVVKYKDSGAGVVTKMNALVDELFKSEPKEIELKGGER